MPILTPTQSKSPKGCSSKLLRAMRRNPPALAGWTRRDSAFCAAGLIAIAMLSGCQQPSSVAPSPKADPIEVALMEQARRSSDAVRALAESEIARQPPAPAVSEADVPDELRRLITLRYTGPIDPALRAIASELGYSFVVTGLAPISAIVVDIKAESIPAYQLVENIGTQAGTRADVLLSPTYRKIELRYAKQD